MSYVKVNNNFRSFDGLMKDLFNEFPAAVSKTVREDVLHFPPVNITELKDKYLVSLSVPGYTKEDIKVKLDSNVLTVSSEKNEAEKVEGAKMIRNEFGMRAFKRSFTINEKIDTENIAAKYENGILTLELPKKEVTASTKDISIA